MPSPRKRTLTEPAPPVLLTRAEALKLAESLEERLQLLAGSPLDADVLTQLRALCTGKRPYGVDFDSGPWRYHFYIHRRGRRLTVTRRRVPRQPAVEQLAKMVRSLYSCPECHRTFPRRGRQEYCSQKCKVAHRRRKRNGTLWTEERLSPEARANGAVADYVRGVHDRAQDAMARKEQYYRRTIGKSRPD